MNGPYWSSCQLCGSHYDQQISVCINCETDEYLTDQPFEEKDRSK